jgi:glutathione peroxidase
MKEQGFFLKSIVCLFVTTMLLSGGPMKSIYDFTMTAIDGTQVPLESYRGKVLLVVNVASKCGFTPQYEGLEALYKEYKDQGLVILGFPANNFLNQEPGSNEEIVEFCRINYGVTFPLFAKLSVKGRDIHPLYDFLTSKKTNPSHGGKITWNFNKFLIGRDGTILNRFDTRTKPRDETVITALEAALKEG